MYLYSKAQIVNLFLWELKKIHIPLNLMLRSPGRLYSNETKEDFYIGLIDCFGCVKWTRTFGGPGTDLCYDLMQASDGDFIVVGASNSFNDNGKFDFYAVKFDTHGNTIWTKTFPTPDIKNYYAKNVFETSYGSFQLIGSKFSDPGPAEEAYLVEFIYPTKFNISFESDRQHLNNPPFSVQFTNKTSNAEYYDFVWHFGDGESLASNNSSVYHVYDEEGWIIYFYPLLHSAIHMHLLIKKAGHVAE